MCRLNLIIVAPKTLMIKMDKMRLSSLMIEIMRFFYIKREYDTSSKAMQELRRLILRGSLEEVTRGHDFPGLMFRGRNFKMQSFVDYIFSMRSSKRNSL